MSKTKTLIKVQGDGTKTQVELAKGGSVLEMFFAYCALIDATAKNKELSTAFKMAMVVMGDKVIQPVIPDDDEPEEREMRA